MPPVRSIPRNITQNFDRSVGYSYHSTRGHKGAVLSVDAGVGGEYIATAGEDGTVRVWKFFVERVSCFKRIAVLEHQGVVTSTSFAGTDGPVAGATDQGAVVLWQKEKGPDGSFGSYKDTHMPFGDTGVQHMSLKKIQHDKDGSWLVACACGKQAKMLKAFWNQSAGKFRFEDAATLWHDNPVLKTAHCPGSVDEGAAIATITSKGLRLWNIAGECVVRLTEPNGKEMEKFAIAPGLKGWIVAGGEDMVSIWAMDNGALVDKDGQVEKLDPPPKPMAQYVIPQKVAHVGIDRNHQYIIVGRKDYRTETFCIVPEPGDEAVGPNEPASLILKEPKSLFEIDYVPTADMHAMGVFLDMDQEAELLLGFADGKVLSWDLDGDDAGEITSELRSLKMTEVILPIALLMLDFAQVTSFAFGPSTSWGDEVAIPAKVTSEIVLFDYEIAFAIDRQKIFWPQILSVLGLMVFFVLAAVIGLRAELAGLKRRSQRHGHIFVGKIFRALEKAQALVMFVCSTVCVVPVWKTLARAVDCIHSEHGPPYLAGVPNLHCYVGRHKKLVIALGVIAPVFFYVLMAHAVVAGDVKYVSRKSLFRPTTWKKAATRKACAMYRGVMHPHSDGVFVTLLAETLAKIALPCVTILETANPIQQMSMVSALGAALYFTSLRWLPLANASFCAIKRGTLLYTLCAMLCGLATTIFGKTAARWTTAAFVASEVIVIVATVILAYRESVFVAREDKMSNVALDGYSAIEYRAVPPEDHL